MSTRHTPGPWEAVDGVCVRTAREADGRGGILVADLYPATAFRPAEERKANARLIQEAPNLLSLAYSARAELEAARRRHPEPSIAHVVEDLSAAIDRVEGRSS